MSAVCVNCKSHVHIRWELEREPVVFLMYVSSSLSCVLMFVFFGNKQVGCFHYIERKGSRNLFLPTSDLDYHLH